MARVFIGVGHGGKDPGAVANGLREANINLTVALSLRKELMRHGVDVGISRLSDEDDVLAEEIREANAYKPDLAIDVHTNAGGGDGFEVYVQTNRYAERSRALALALETQVKAIGQNSRGIKTKLNASGTDWFGWVRQVNCPAVLVEGAFIDTCDRYFLDTTPEQEALGVAYAKGVLALVGITWHPDDAQQDNNQRIHELQTALDAAKAAHKAAQDKLDSLIGKVQTLAAECRK